MAQLIYLGSQEKGNPPSEFPPNTLYHICCGIQRYLRGNGRPHIDFFSDLDFSEFKCSLDAKVKRLQSTGIGSKQKQAEPLTGIGSKQKQAEPLTDKDVELLWEKNLLGDSTPQSLLDTYVFFNGLCFALRSGKEHHQLRHNPAQIKVVENPNERPHLIYTEDISKNRPGGIKGRQQKPKIVIHHANLEQPKCYFVRLKLYNSLCPKDCSADSLYLQPLSQPRADFWYSKQPYGHNHLAGTVARLCKKAGISGYKTNKCYLAF